MSAPFPHDVGIAIVCHNNREKLAATLASLQAAGCESSRILVADALSSDGTAEWLRETHPGVRVHALDRNDGPNPGRNLGIRETPHPYVFLMDADVQVLPDTIVKLRAAMAAEPAVKIGSPIVVHADAPETIQYAGGHLHFICEAINPWMNRPLAQRGTAREDVGIASANGLLIEREAAIGIGLFDERYFMGKDDGDFTHRMRLAGHRILELPDALVLHRSRPRSDWLFYYQVRNRWHFMLKNYQWRTLVALLPCLVVHETLQMAMLHAAGHGRTYWRALRGLVAMLPALPHDRAQIRRLRRVSDATLLKSDRLIVRDDLVRHPLARWGKGAYEAALTAYWWLLRHTVFAR